MKHLLILFFSLLNSVTLCAEEPEDTAIALGMWSWRHTAFSTQQQRNELLNFCRKHDITHVDQHLSLKKNGKGAFIERAEALKLLVIQASKNGISINALRGEKDMFYSKNHTRTLQDLRAVIRFNKSLPATAKLRGIKFDVEPYLTAEWKAGGAKRSKVKLDYLNFLMKAKAELNKRQSKLKLSVDVPFWWDDKEHDMVFRGKRQHFVSHIQDLTDEMGIMSYRRTSKAVLNLAQGELAHAKRTSQRKSVSVGLETTELKGAEAVISFHGTPVQSFHKTIRELRQSLRNETAANFIMLHEYSSLRNYLK